MSNKTNRGQQPTQEEKRRNVKIPVTCWTCMHAKLHRWDNNPVLAECHKKPQAFNKRFPFEIEIASVLRLCVSYDETQSENVVEQRYKKAV